ncbi:hypothetical protein [Sphingomonas sp. DBB INV C78]|uniref:hypothetical protein n=1 Tax=Sphingomonas sp. DBB INV C78 TaxID=3349434 RepID=UPI0036D29720
MRLADRSLARLSAPGFAHKIHLPRSGFGKSLPLLPPDGKALPPRESAPAVMVLPQDRDDADQGQIALDVLEKIIADVPPAGIGD